LIGVKFIFEKYNSNSLPKILKVKARTQETIEKTFAKARLKDIRRIFNKKTGHHCPVSEYCNLIISMHEFVMTRKACLSLLPLYDCTLSCHQPKKIMLDVQLNLLWTVVYGVSAIIRKSDSK